MGVPAGVIVLSLVEVGAKVGTAGNVSVGSGRGVFVGVAVGSGSL